ncbi:MULTISPECIES: transcription antitermination factor NusB [Psychrobacter]|jgi:N utilization substance protein B|uniref:transcription antitermination factor NusB n=1 Tax=Psychrobacter TaxID=497 RepID=UPI0009EED6FE|nr:MULTISPECIES: transcription antitermination factor NusB [Psychrobacter]WLW66274.1 transcription antitermination factor NusB [Psychrobacter sp. van23A]HCR86908.1 transcription antitermination factor NusB [Psychrobacter sp.]
MTDQLKRAINAAQTAQANDAQAEATRIASSSAGEQTFDMSETTYKTSHTAVRKARRFAMQGLYEWLVTDRRFDKDGKLGWKDNAPHDIAARTRASNAMHTVHIGYYHEMMRDIPEQIDALDALISRHLDRDIDKLDTVEHAILLIGAYELQNRLEIPYKVVLDEAMKLNNHFGATDAHKLINAVLDKMAIELRALEVDADSKANLRTSQKAATQANAKQAEVQSAAVEEASESTAESDIDSTSTATASNKPRISANNASVKRNSASKALANIMDYKINKKNDAAKNEAPNNIVNDKSAEESAVEENTSTNDVSYDENSDAADVGLHDSNLVTPNENNKD